MNEKMDINEALQYSDREYLKQIANNMFTIDEILEVWYSVYGEDMAEPKFIDELRQRLS